MIPNDKPFIGLDLAKKALGVLPPRCMSVHLDITMTNTATLTYVCAATTDQVMKILGLDKEDGQ